jgi:hypothetical protein
MIKVFSNQFVVFKTGLTSFLFGFLFLAFFYTAPAQTYSWSNVAMGGGGFVSGIITSKTEANVMYARTDVGGAYRWDNANGKWIPLLDWNSTSQTGYQGVESIALDPSTAGRVYMLVGTSYFNSGQTAILKSNDYGSTFTTTVITSQFQAHGNGMGRQAGERLAVDPNNPNILFCGTRLDGLWKSTNAGSTWSRVWTGSSGTDIVNDNGVCFVVFDPSSVSSGITQNIYIGVCRTGSANIYKSTDAGASFTAISATTSLMPQRAALSGTTMYVTHSDSEGPWGPTSGAVYKLNTSTGAWTNVTPATGRAYCGVSVSPTDPTRVIVSTTNFYNINQYSSVWGDAIYLSTNGGTGWTLKSSGITLNDNGAGWIVGQSIHWAGSIEFDPSNTAKAWVGSGNVTTLTLLQPP